MFSTSFDLSSAVVVGEFSKEGMVGLELGRAANVADLPLEDRYLTLVSEE